MSLPSLAWLLALATACAGPLDKAPAARLGEITSALDVQGQDAQSAEQTAVTAPQPSDPLDTAADVFATDGPEATGAEDVDAAQAHSPSDTLADDGTDVIAAETAAEVGVLPDAATPTAADALSPDTVDAAVDTSPGADTASPKYGTCLALLNCVQGACSPTWPEYCAAECEAEASPAALSAWEKGAKGIKGCPIKCMNKPVGCAQACANDMLLFSKILCTTAGQSGTASCAEVVACMNDGCTANDDGCVLACAAKASATAVVDLMAMVECAKSSSGKGLVVGCSQQMFTCMSGGATGAASCFQTASCADACMQSGAGGEEACLGACYAKASAPAQQTFVPFFKCLLAAGAATNDCAGPLLACVPGGGSAGCAAVAQCIAKCTATNPGSACALACLDKAAPGQGAKWLTLEGCMVANCKSCLGKPCEVSCRDAHCALPWQSCTTP